MSSTHFCRFGSYAAKERSIDVPGRHRVLWAQAAPFMLSEKRFQVRQTNRDRSMERRQFCTAVSCMARWMGIYITVTIRDYQGWAGASRHRDGLGGIGSGLAGPDPERWRDIDQQGRTPE